MAIKVQTDVRKQLKQYTYILALNVFLCFSFGRNAGVVALPANCEALNDGCHSIEVSSSNKSKSCQNETLDFDTLSKKLPHPDNAYT